MLLAMTLLSLSVVLNVPGRPLDQMERGYPAQPKPSPMLTVEAHAPTDPMLIHAAMLTQMNGTNTLKFQTEPQWKLGTNTLVTGLIVDGLEPKQTWKMLNPAPSASDSTRLTTWSPSPVKAARCADNNLADHESDFALLRFSLGSPPKLIKPQP